MRWLAVLLVLSACAPGPSSVETPDLPEAAAPPPATDALSEATDLPAAEELGETPDPAEMQDEATRPGLFARVLGRSRREAHSEASIEAPNVPPAAELPEADTDAVEVAPPDETDAPEAEPEVEPVAARSGFFGRVFRGSGGGTRAALPAPESAEDLQYGEIIAVCGTPRQELGTEVARYAGRRGPRLYDSNPSTVALRPHYITGFSDGCPRKFLAALALFGGPTAYEASRLFDEDNLREPSETDRAYRRIRRRVCGTPVGQDCARDRFQRLEDNAVFVSVYQRFGTNPDWADMLIYEGEVVAKDFKTIR
ncbi:MAG: hypothetical protein AAFZ02_05385 [Pseudomonadota bacterium]